MTIEVLKAILAQGVSERFMELAGTTFFILSAKITLQLSGLYVMADGTLCLGVWEKPDNGVKPLLSSSFSFHPKYSFESQFVQQE